MPPVYTDQQLADFASCRLTEFRDDFVLASIANPDDRLTAWLDDVARIVDTSAPLTELPLALAGAQFAETRDGNRGDSIGMGSLELRTAEYDAGYEMPLLQLILDPAVQSAWDAASGDLVNEARRHHAKMLATLLDAGDTTTSQVDGAVFFSSAHPSAGGTWSNLQSTPAAVSVAAITTEIAAMQAQSRDRMGTRLSVGPYAVMVPLAKSFSIAAALAKANLSGGESNPLTPFGIRVVANPYLDPLDADDWYILDLGVLARQPALFGPRLDPGSALSLRQFGTESDFFKSTGRIKNSLHVWQGAALGFPAGIRRVVGE
jgi:hypothetical protein